MVKRVPVTLYGQRIGWAVENDGIIYMDIEDQQAISWISEGLTVGLSIDHDKYGE